MTAKRLGEVELAVRSEINRLAPVLPVPEQGLSRHSEAHSGFS
jgi:hypothetical protein